MATREIAGRHGSARLGVALLVVTVFAWGLTWPINKLILAHLSPLWLSAIRTVIAVIAMLAITGLSGRLRLPPRQDLPVLCSIALLHMVGFSVMGVIGLTMVPAGRSVVLAYTTPLWVIPGAALFLRERLTARKLLGAAIGLAGLVVLFNPLAFDWRDRDALIGNGALLLAAFLWASSILHIRGHRWRSTPFDLVFWELLLAAVVLNTLAILIDGAPRFEPTTSLVLLLLYIGLPGTALAYWAIAMASRDLPAVTTSLGLLGAPVIGIAAAVLALGEALDPLVLLAGALILGGVAIGTIEREEPRG
jgi:drug/metabolite transporter (DMT)-like permease